MTDENKSINQASAAQEGRQCAFQNTSMPVRPMQGDTQGPSRIQGLGVNRPTQEALEEIVRRVADEWQVGGMGPDSMYGEFAIEVAKRALAVPPEAEATDGGITQALAQMARANAIEECAKVASESYIGSTTRYVGHETTEWRYGVPVHHAIRAIDGEPLPQRSSE